MIIPGANAIPNADRSGKPSDKLCLSKLIMKTLVQLRCYVKLIINYSIKQLIENTDRFKFSLVLLEPFSTNRCVTAVSC